MGSAGVCSGQSSEIWNGQWKDSHRLVTDELKEYFEIHNATEMEKSVMLGY